jgi:RHH-type proline utilization regulon transcriptional repressor/proline dehydrogenase/delta 1-pyrroline-5-carboxylate dehydrogenase
MPGQIDRSALRAAYRMEEEACLAERIRQAAPASEVLDQASLMASG